MIKVHPNDWVNDRLLEFIAKEMNVIVDKLINYDLQTEEKRIFADYVRFFGELGYDFPEVNEQVPELLWHKYIDDGNLLNIWKEFELQAAKDITQGEKLKENLERLGNDKNKNKNKNNIVL